MYAIRSYYAQAALAGGPAPAFDDLGALEPEEEEQEQEDEEESPSGESEAVADEGVQAPAPAEAPVMEEEGRTPQSLPPADLLSMASGAEESTEASVITSYSIHYTKLYDEPFSAKTTS